MIINRDANGSMPEWLMGVDCKSTGYAYAGSNPARPIYIEKYRKEGVNHLFFYGLQIPSPTNIVVVRGYCDWKHNIAVSSKCKHKFAMRNKLNIRLIE